jgi:urea transporter
MPEEVNAWGNYDQVAREARGIKPRGRRAPGQHDTRSSDREHRRSSSRSSSRSGARLSSSRHSISEHFLEHLPREVSKRDLLAEYFEKDEDEETGDLPTEVGKSPEALYLILPALSQTIREDINDIFSIYFEGSHTAKKTKRSPFSCVIAYFNATMPSSQPFILSTFGHFKQVILFIELSLRGISQVYFQNNPLSGLLILIGLFIQSTRVGVYGLLALVSGNLTAYSLGFDNGLARSGLFGYNALLVGLALATFDSTEKHSDYSVVVAVFSIVISSFSSILLVTLGKLLHPYKSPPLTLPFNMATMMFLVATANMFRVETGPVRPPALPDFDLHTFEHVTASQFFAGTIRGLGQVYLADNLVAGFFVLAGICVSSRIAAGVALFGSFIGSGVALATGVNPALVEAGLYGYNASLSVTALFTFYCPSKGTTILAILAGVMTVVAQQALSALLEPFGLPVLTLPFCIIALPFIILQGTTSSVVAIPLPQLTVPEDHLHRVRALEEGVNFLKECLHPEEKRFYGFRMLKNIRKIDKAMQSDTNSKVKKGDKASGYDMVNFVRIFDALKEPCSTTLTVQSFTKALSQSGLSDAVGRRFATLVFNLMDLDHSKSKSVDEKQFIALCLVSCAVTTIRRKISEFFHFVDVDSDGWIDFEKLDSALEYLGQSALSADEQEYLITMTGTEDDEMEVVDLINLLTAHKLKTTIEAYRNSSYF